jgi:hypothetical protein
MTITLAWHGDPALKAEALASMQAHRAADEIMQGSYLFGDTAAAAGYRGCFHGCLTADKLIAESGVDRAAFVRGIDFNRRSVQWHAEGQRIWGIPEELGAALDHTFEMLTEPAHAAFAVDAIEAMPVGADLSQVVDRTIVDFLADPERGAWRAAPDGPEREAVQRVGGLYVRRLAGNEPDLGEWDAARNAADELTPDDVGSDAVLAAYYAADIRDRHAADVFSYVFDFAYHAAPDAAWKTWAASRLLHHMATAPVPVTT